jgi:GTPase Era involved in 16S rRNA processing
MAYWLFLAAVLLFIAPYLFVFGIGTWWLWRQGMVWFWAVGTGVPTLVGLVLMEKSRRMIFPSAAVVPQSSAASTPTGKAAMDSVQAISKRLQAENPPLEQPEVLEKVARDVFLEILETVARHYHPNAKRPVLDTPVAHVAALIELVADDFRRTFTNSVPWGKTVTLGRLLWWKEKGDLAWRAGMYWWQINRIRRMCFRPATAIVQEVQDHLGQNMTAKTLDGLKQSAIEFCISRAGEYAIQLYSGGFVLERESRPRISAPVESVPFEQEPLQILVVGQVKSGKSSLINAMLGEMRAPVDALPATEEVNVYECQPEGLPPVIVRDTPGYGMVDDAKDPFSRLRNEIEQCDLMIMVCSARSAARKADREFLSKLHEYYQGDAKRMMPPVVFVMTHIDEVPEHLVSEAASAVAADFSVTPIQIVPLCGKWGRLANLDGFATVIQEKLPDAERLKIARCIRQIRREQDEDKIVRQLLSGLRLAGGWVVKQK